MAPNPGPDPKDEHAAKALDVGADFIKVSVSLATGAFVFGIGLFANTGVLLDWERVALVLAEIALITSIVAGYGAYSRVPIMLHRDKPDIHDDRLTLAGRWHQLAFLAGIVIMAIVLGRNLFMDPAVDSLRVGSADEAVTAVLRAVDPTWRAQGVQTIEFVKGADAARAGLGVWHLRVSVTRRSDRAQKRPRSLDYFVEPRSGVVRHVP
ncbi:MAG: hypothetical protein JWM87_2624 [Candidatus Eremiobacteraeota bacterium]|nr:hypothetical protein [Candidatus Eremiobacteraeota bacterium]